MKKKTNISDKVIGLINQKQIKPIPRWEFMAKNWGLWLGFGGCLILLILGISVSWFGLIDNIIIPYFWIVVTLIFFGLTYFIFEKTKRAYFFQKWKIALLIGLTTLIVGGGLFKAGLGSRIDRSLELSWPYYRQMVPMKMLVWNNPQQGYLSGEITDILDENHFRIKDFNGNIWMINGKNLLIRGRAKIITGEEIKLIGEQRRDNVFDATEIRPWNGPGENKMKENE